MLDHLVHRAHSKRPVSGHRIARYHQRQCRLDADQARQPLRAAGAGQQPQLDFGQTHAGIGTGHPVVATERDLEAAAQRRAVDGCNHRFGAGFQGRHHLRQVWRHGRLAKFANIRAGDKGATCAFENNRLCRMVVDGALQRLHEARTDLLGQRVDRW